jgi:hypothetical protein
MPFAQTTGKNKPEGKTAIGRDACCLREEERNDARKTPSKDSLRDTLRLLSSGLYRRLWNLTKSARLTLPGSLAGFNRRSGLGSRFRQNLTATPKAVLTASYQKESSESSYCASLGREARV